MDAALFVDFDGTLAPIAARPQDVCVPSWVIPVLGALQRRQDGALALVSGRQLAQIDDFLQPLLLPAAGAHGAERRGTSGRLEVQTAAPPPAAVACARALAKAHRGLLLEPKPGGFALHYRKRPELEALCRAALQAALRDVSIEAPPSPRQPVPLQSAGAAAQNDELTALQRDWELMQGHCVFELKQRRVSKGMALRAFMAEAPFAGRIPVYAGDDVTDEDGIEAAQALGGWGVRVGPGATAARYRLADVDAVGRWLGAAATAEVLPLAPTGGGVGAAPPKPASAPGGG
ncbi:MAG: HAD-IIB family hydrolase [Burkholderiaceae bacterium]